jgi:glycosyltransferase involved in cell wall biosynthesis
MRILMITAGAASMYCGSCLRDNALASALKKKGHDVTLMPVYTPTLTDEENVSDAEVFFGGISVYLQQKYAFFRYTPPILDKLLFDNPAALKLASQRKVSVDPAFLGEMTVDMLKGISGPIGKEFRKFARWLKDAGEFDTIIIPFTLLIALAEPIRRLKKTKILCTLQGEDLFLEGLPEPHKSQALDLIRSHVPTIDIFLAVSRYYAGFMSAYLDIPREKIRIAPLGINLTGYFPKPRSEREIRKIGFFARIDPAKGLHNLLEASQLMQQRDFSIEAAGYLLPEHAPYLEDLQSRFSFTYHGTLTRDQKAAFLQDIDIFCVPTDYKEPKGLFVLEALANGAPVVLPAHGAFPELLQRTGGGVLFEPGSAHALAESLDQLIADTERRLQLAAQGAEAVAQYYSASAMADATLAALESPQTVTAKA